MKPRSHSSCISIPFPSLRSVIGTPFYLMDYVPGRVFKNPSLAELAREERGGFYSAMCEVLAAIHSVDIAKVGLEDFGKKGETTFGQSAVSY